MINSTLWQNNISMNYSNTLQAINATCPACGLLCDDVLLENKNNQILISSNSGARNCVRSVAFFEQKFSEATPLIAGKRATLTQAIAKVAEILKLTKQPLFSGLSTDVTGFRAVFDLAQKTNGHLTHINAKSLQRNLSVLQSTGWQTTTMTEVKNRADVIVCIGTDVVSHNPRFFERVVWPKDAMFVDSQTREVIYIGENLDTKAGISPKGNTQSKHPSLLACRADALAEVTGALRALVLGKSLNTPNIAGISLSDLTALADKLKQAKYAVLIWIAKDLDFPYAELTIQNITQTVATLNEKTRAGGLALGGSDGDTTANYANTWLSGLALNDKAAAHDAVIWVNSFSPNKHAPETNLPFIVLGNSNIEFANTRTPDVFIPIATPGLDCSGTLFRVDSSVVLPLKKVRENSLPTLAQVISQIEAAL